jgi:hypothetical protein
MYGELYRDPEMTSIYSSSVPEERWLVVMGSFEWTLYRIVHRSVLEMQ